MRIVVETEHESYMVSRGPDGSEAITVKVSIDGHEDLGLTRLLTQAEMRSHFDIIWEFLGNRIKDMHAERNRAETNNGHKR